MIFYKDCYNQIETVKQLYRKYGDCAVQSSNITLCLDRKLQPTWACYRDNIHLTIATANIIKDAKEPVIDILKQYGGQFKSPNDIYINKKKVCGILVFNNTQERDGIASTMIGIGLNINSAPEYAISISEVVNKKQNIRSWVNALVNQYLE